MLCRSFGRRAGDLERRAFRESRWGPTPTTAAGLGHQSNVWIQILRLIRFAASTKLIFDCNTGAPDTPRGAGDLLAGIRVVA